MNTFVKKVAGILPDLEACGKVYLFALAERGDVDLWDVVVSSMWSDHDWTAAVRTIVALLKPRLFAEEIAMISRVGIISSTDPRVQEMPASLDGVVIEDDRVINVPLFATDVRRTFVFKAQRPLVTVPHESLAGASGQI